MADGTGDRSVGGAGDAGAWAGALARARATVEAFAATPAARTVPDLLAPLSIGWNDAALAHAQAAFWTGAGQLADAFAGTAMDGSLGDLPERAHRLMADALLAHVDAITGLDAKQHAQLRFAAQGWVAATAPGNLMPFNGPAMARAVETRGESLVRGLANLLDDLARGQITHSRPGAFELGRDLATTPGKVVFETPLFQLIQYAPATERVGRAPLLIFPPWINRFYILDLGPEKSFVQWAVAQGLTVFMISWRSADDSLSDVTIDNYAAAQTEAMAVVRALLAVERVHVIGYCVAGSVLAAVLAVLAARGEAGQVASATFLTAQVDFADAGDLSLFVDDAWIQRTAALAAEHGVLDGRYMAAAFNMLRPRDLIWRHARTSYLLGEEREAFDLLHWNGDVTNLPARWHGDYLRDFYRDNLLVVPGALTVLGEPVDLRRVATPCYIQAGRDDHIAPARSVWQATRHFAGPLRFVLAGSGHIAGVVNPPSANKYQHWINEAAVDTLDAFVATATEVRGSWWPDWRRWIGEHDGEDAAADGARVPGGGRLPAIEDAPGSYVRMR